MGAPVNNAMGAPEAPDLSTPGKVERAFEGLSRLYQRGCEQIRKACGDFLPELRDGFKIPFFSSHYTVEVMRADVVEKDERDYHEIMKLIETYGAETMLFEILPLPVAGDENAVPRLVQQIRITYFGNQLWQWTCGIYSWGRVEAGSDAPGVPHKPDLYRSPAAPVVWWVWAVFALANLADIAVQGHDHFAAQIAAILILITWVAYVTAFRPRVLADDTGITIRNPLRDHQVPWACVQNVDLGDSLQVHCAWQDGEQKTKLLYGWAVHSPRRARLKAEARARRSDRAAARQSASYHRLPARPGRP